MALDGSYPEEEGRRSSPANVLILAAEDTPNQIRERLEAAGADLDRVHVVTDEAVTFPKSNDWFERTVTGLDISLVVIDPLLSFMDKEIDSHKDHDVRRLLRPLTAIAGRTGAAVVLVGHLN